MIGIVLGAVAVYYGATVASYWAALAGFKWKKRDPKDGRSRSAQHNGLSTPGAPFLIAIAPTRSAAESIPGMVKTLKAQAYPQDRYRVIILVDPDGPNDPSSQLARSAGAEVFERTNVEIRTKGAGLNELLATLRHESFDAAIVLDIDARVEPLFFQKIAAHLAGGAHILQGAPVGKNADRSGVARLGEAAQGLANLIQQGRTAIGLSAALSGTGMVFTRSALEMLEWQTSTGRHISDDGELNLRCYLYGLPVTYAPDLRLWNDLPEDARSVRLQRRRWFAAYAELIPSYLGRLFQRALMGHWRVLEGTFNLLFLPSCSLSLVLGGLAAVVLSSAAWFHPLWRPWAVVATSLFILHALYYVLALNTIGFQLTASEFRRLPGFLVMRAAAILDGIRLACHPNPGHHATPASHSDDSHVSQLKGVSS